MNLKNRAYSVLIVSASESFPAALSSVMPESRFAPVQRAQSISNAKRMAAQRPYDLILINSPLPDDSGVKFAIDTAAGSQSQVLLLVPGNLYPDVRDKAIESGVFTLPKPVARTVMMTALDWLLTARERLRKAEKKTLSIEEKMEEIRLVNKAKWILISKEKMDEASAHRFIEKQAMDLCLSRKEIAEDIIRSH